MPRESKWKAKRLEMVFSSVMLRNKVSELKRDKEIKHKGTKGYSNWAKCLCCTCSVQWSCWEGKVERSNDKVADAGSHLNIRFKLQFTPKMAANPDTLMKSRRTS